MSLIVWIVIALCSEEQRQFIRCSRWSLQATIRAHSGFHYSQLSIVKDAGSKQLSRWASPPETQRTMLNWQINWGSSNWAERRPLDHSWLVTHASLEFINPLLFADLKTPSKVDLVATEKFFVESSVENIPQTPRNQRYWLIFCFGLFKLSFITKLWTGIWLIISVIIMYFLWRLVIIICSFRQPFRTPGQVTHNGPSMDFRDSIRSNATYVLTTPRMDRALHPHNDPFSKLAIIFSCSNSWCNPRSFLCFFWDKKRGTCSNERV